MNFRNILNIGLLLILLLAVPVAVTLVRQQQILRSKATVETITFRGDNVALKNGKLVAIDKDIQVGVVSPFESVEAPTADLALTEPFTPASPSDSQSVTVRFSKNAKTNWVMLLIDSPSPASQTSPIQLAPPSSCPADGCSLVWPSDHPKHTPGTHTLGIMPYYCDPTDTNRANCTIGTADYGDSIEISGGTVADTPTPAQGASATCSGSQLRVQWTLVTGASNYTVRVDNVANGWSPEYTGSDCSSPTTAGASGDRACEAGDHNRATINLGSYTGNFGGTVTPSAGAVQSFSAVSCGSSGGGGGGAPSLSGTPSVQPTSVAVGGRVVFSAAGTNTTRIGINIFYHDRTYNPPPADIAGTSGCNTPSGTNCQFSWTVPSSTPPGTHTIRFTPINGSTVGAAQQISLVVTAASSFLPFELVSTVLAQAVPGCGASCDAGRPCSNVNPNLSCWGGECRSPAVPNDPTCPGVVATVTPPAGTVTPVAASPTPVPTLAPLRTRTDAPAGTTTTHFKVSEVNSDAAWGLATLNTYTPGETNIADYTFSANNCVTTPCDLYPRASRRVFVQFIGTTPAGTEYKEVWSADIILGLKPVITSAACSVPPTGTGTLVTLSGEHFGDEVGAVSLGAVATSAVPAASWTNLEVTANSTQGVAEDKDVVVTSVDGTASDPIKCGVGKAAIDFKATLSCRSSEKPLSTADVEIKEDTPQGKSVYKQSAVSFDSEGRPQGLIPELTEGKTYKIIVKAPNSLSKVIKFTAGAGTTGLEAMNLPLGDVSPDRGDCQINQLDRSRLISEWAAGKESTKKSDLNLDGRVNSLDYSCLMSNFRKECEKI